VGRHWSLSWIVYWYYIGSGESDIGSGGSDIGSGGSDIGIILVVEG
jgi:hypothetical protein